MIPSGCGSFRLHTFVDQPLKVIPDWSRRYMTLKQEEDSVQLNLE
jgi:hypothetical protein